MFSSVSPRFPVLSHVSPCFSMFFYAFPWLSGVLHEILTNRLEKSTKSVPRTRRGFRLSPAFFTLNSRWPRRWDAEENRGVSPLDRWNQSFEALCKWSKCYISTFWVLRHPEACDIRVNCHAMLFIWGGSLASFVCLLDRRNRFDMAALYAQRRKSSTESYFSVVVVPSSNGDQLERFCDLNKGISPLLFRSTTRDTTAGNLGDSGVRYVSLNASRS